MSKRLKITLIILLVMIIITIAIILTQGINIKLFNIGNFNFKERISSTLMIEKEYDNPFEEINIDSETAKIEIKSTKEGKPKVIIFSEKTLVTLDDNDSKLTLNIKTQECTFLCLNIKQTKVEIYLPNDYSGQINIKNDYGDINISEFNNATANIVSAAGDINIVSINEGDITNAYGDINISNNANNLSITSASGDITIDEVSDITLVNNYGDITINKVTNSLYIEEDSGDIKINNLNITMYSKIINHYGDINIGNTNDIYIDTDTDLGDIRINNNNRKSEITLTIENNAGDITVDN